MSYLNNFFILLLTIKKKYKLYYKKNYVYCYLKSHPFNCYLIIFENVIYIIYIPFVQCAPSNNE